MAVLSGATASGRQMYQGQPTTTNAIVYSAPSANSNVTSPSSTSYIKEISICNLTSNPATITVYVTPTTGSCNPINAILYGLSVLPNDTKIISGLNTMIPAGGAIWAFQGTASAITLTISGTEVQ